MNIIGRDVETPQTFDLFLLFFFLNDNKHRGKELPDTCKGASGLFGLLLESFLHPPLYNSKQREQEQEYYQTAKTSNHISRERDQFTD